MKKLFALAAFILVVIVFSNCHGSKKSTTSVPAVAKVTYDGGFQSVVAAKCSPCHFPPRGNKKPFDSYEAVRSNIDSMIARISLNPGQRGFMPFRGQKLSDSVINVFKQWRKDGMLK
jgi:hypothetical protein